MRQRKNGMLEGFLFNNITITNLQRRTTLVVWWSYFQTLLISPLIYNGDVVWCFFAMNSETLINSIGVGARAEFPNNN